MIRSLIMLCAEGVVRDITSNNVSMFNMVEDIFSAGFPLFIQRLYIFNLLEKENGDPQIIDCEYEVYNNNERIIAFPARIDFLNSMRNRSIGTINGLTINAPGLLRFRILTGGRELASYTVRVNATNPTAGAVEGTAPGNQR